MPFRIPLITLCLLMCTAGKLYAQLTQITDDELDHIHLHWFPDGKRLISAVTSGGGKMFIVSASTGEVSGVDIGDDLSGDFYNSISPDGQILEDPGEEKQEEEE